MENNSYHGITTALFTPFKNSAIDYQAVEMLLQMQNAAKIDGILVGGSTGEGNSISKSHKKELLEFVKKTSDDHAKIIYGISSASTDEAVEMLQEVEDVDIDAVMITVPYYTKPNQKGILEHYKSLSDATSLPIIAYVHPGRTGVDLTDDTFAKLMEIDNVKSVKDCGESIKRTIRLKNLIGENQFLSLTGDDPLIIPFLASGGDGCISVLSNLMPNCLMKISKLMRLGDFASVREIQADYQRISDAVYADVNPIGIKLLGNLMNICSDELKLPLIPATDNIKRDIEAIVPLVKKLEDWGCR